MERRQLQARARAAMAGTPNVIAGRANPATALLHAMRPRLWLKYLLVFVPALAAHAASVTALFQSLFAFCAFSICASGTCLLIEARDAWEERRHPARRSRSMEAAGASQLVHTLHIPLALGVGAALVMLSLSLPAWIEPQLMLVVAGYFVATLLYSTWLKRLLITDIVTLAVLDCIPIIGGSAITRIEPSSLLLASFFFMFLSLALLGRHSELARLQSNGEIALSGSSYTTVDKAPLAMIGAASGLLAMFTAILYFNSPDILALYRHPLFLVGMLPLLVYWLGRLWTMSFRGRVEEGPLLYVSRDRASIAVFALCAALAGAASF